MADNYVRIATLIMGRAIVDETGKPSPDFLRAFNGNNENLKTAFEKLDGIVGDLGDAVTLIQQALEQAGIALETAEAVEYRQKVSDSYTNPTAILTATANATDVTVTIADHTRVYGDGTTAAITGGTIEGLAFGTRYYIYYDEDPENGPSFQYSTSEFDAAQGNGRLSCGNIVTPTDNTSPPSGGGGPKPPGTGTYEP